MKHILEDTGISLRNIHDSIQLSSHPWQLNQSVVILDLNKVPKNKTHPLTYQEKLNNIQERYLSHFHIFKVIQKATMEPNVEQFSTSKPRKNLSQKRPPYFLQKSGQ